MNLRKELPKKYNKLPTTEAVETAKQRLTALATRLKRYTREVFGVQGSVSCVIVVLLVSPCRGQGGADN